YPANFSAPNIISVLATDDSDNRAGFSNFGPSTVHLGAPGVSIYSTVSGSAGYASESGTSMAVPFVSGAALLTLSVCPALSTGALKSALLNNVDIVSGLAGLTITGGRLNANKAVRSCASTPPPTGLTIFPAGTTPTQFYNDMSTVELGVRFRS